MTKHAKPTQRESSLTAHEDKLISQVGGWFPGERTVFRGQDLHTDLADIDWMDLYLFGITGRRFSADALKLLNAIWTYTSYPDPRLWNNRVAALAGTARSTGALGVSAATAVSEASIYGRQADIKAITFVLHAKEALDSGYALEDLVATEFKTHRAIGGYGRPIRRNDERIIPIMKKAQALNLHDGPHVRLAFAIEAHLKTHRMRIQMNFGGIAAALCADLGFTPTEYYLWLIPVFTAGMLPCYIEAAQNPAGSFLPLRCERIEYNGETPRKWKA